MKCPKVSIIILNWNGKADTIECLDSLEMVTYPNYEIILVDNGSTDGSVEYFKRTYPKIEIIENKKNLGFAEGNNIAIRKVVERGTDYVLLLNNDTFVDPEFLFNLAKVLEKNPLIGIAGPTVYFYKEKDRIQSVGGKIFWYFGEAPHSIRIIKPWIRDLKYNEIRDVDYIMGCALLAKCELFKKIGYLDKEYFAYWEETEWCVRAKKAGYRIVHVPAAKVWHKGGSTSRKISGFARYHVARNRFWFMKTHASHEQYFIFLIYFFGFKIWLSSARLIIHANFKEYLCFLRGILHGIWR